MENDLNELERGLYQRILKVKKACVPDLLNEIPVEATEEEALEAVMALEARGLVRQEADDPRAEHPQQQVYAADG